MKPICYTCKHRMIGECNANENTFVAKNGSGTMHCDSYEKSLLRDVIDDDNRMYTIINNYTHHTVETLNGKDAKEKYGDCEWCSGYTEYSSSLEWIYIKEDK